MRVWPRHTVNITGKVFSIIFNALIHGELVSGVEVPKFEKTFAQLHEVDNAIGVFSARAGLCLALEGLDFNEGDEIILSAFNYAPIPSVLKTFGLMPIFVDIEESTFNIDPTQIEKRITDKTKAILVTHAFGAPCDMDSVMSIADKYDLVVIEDCAHALGAEYKGKRVGTIGDVGIFSFAMGKNMPCFGGGMVLSRSAMLKDKMRAKVLPYRVPKTVSCVHLLLKHIACFVLMHPRIYKFTTYPLMRLLSVIGIHLSSHDEDEGSCDIACRDTLKRSMANMQAAVGIYQLKRLDEVNKRLRQNGLVYNEMFEKYTCVNRPSELKDSQHAYLYYCFLVGNSHQFQRSMLLRGIDTERNHLSNCASISTFSARQGDYPIARKAAKHSVDLPNNQDLRIEDQRYIVDSVVEILDDHS